MAKEILNEGRVVGMSAYEIFVRHYLSEHPDEDPPCTEREWLSSTLGNGASLILRIPSGTQGLVDYELPANSKLCSAACITAYPFYGKVTEFVDSTTRRWAKFVASYSDALIPNTSSKHPSSSGVPTNPKDMTADEAKMLSEYMKITDGVIYQEGTWRTSGKNEPYMDFNPDFTQDGHVRLYISKALKCDVLILLNGWIHKAVVEGCCYTYQGAVNTNHPENGDFLGVECFPWACKLTLVVPTSSMYALNEHKFGRKLPKSSSVQAMLVTSTAIIDYNTSDPKTYYNTHFTDAPVLINVSELNVIGDDGVSLLAAYQKTSMTPAALYASRITSTGDTNIYPIDVVAPGTLKIYEDFATAHAEELNYPGVHSIYADFANKAIYVLNGDTLGDAISLDTRLSTENLEPADSSHKAYSSVIKSGTEVVKSISLLDMSGNALNRAGTGGSIDLSGDNETDATKKLGEDISWVDLLDGLDNNKKINIIGAKLKTFRSTLPNVVSGTNGVLDIKGKSGSNSKIAGPLQLLDVSDNSKNATLKISQGNSTTANKPTVLYCDSPIKVESSYIEFKGGLRLYIATSAPAVGHDGGIPEGSIGIGW